MNRYIICLIVLFVTFSCSNNRHKKETENYKKQKEINKTKLYYPKAYDKYWFDNQPNLVGAEGTITKDCKKTKVLGNEISKYFGKRIIVKNASLSHKSRGNYNGLLKVKLINSIEEFYIDFKCFEPDYSKGIWLNK